MSGVKAVKELKAVLVGSNSSRKYLVGNIILGKQAFDLKDVTSCCERAEGKVCGRSVTLVKAPGWLRGYDLCNTPELFKTEAILSVTPGLHAVILVINAELPFKNVYKRVTKQHLQHFFGDKVWDHTIVVFSHRSHQDHKSIEDYIRGEGAPLKSLLEECGNRYHVLCDDGTETKKKVNKVFEEIDAMVAKTGCYETDSTLIKNAESKRMKVNKEAEELHLQSQQQRLKLRNLLTQPTLNLRILMVGWVFSGKSATGNSILGADVFQSGDKTVKAVKQSGTVAGREVVIVDTPGWWKFFPAIFTPHHLKSEILRGVSLCDPAPNVILLAVPVDTSFTNDQKRVIEDNIKLLGQRVWRYIIVLFTFGEALGNKTIEQHIESEGEPLHWLIEKCGNRYHVLNNASVADYQVTELLEKMEEMVAGNCSFYISPYSNSEVWENRDDLSTYSKDENTAKEISEQLLIEWDRRYWEKHHSGSMKSPPTMSDGGFKSDDSGWEEEQMKLPHEDEPLTSCFSLDVQSEGDAGFEPLKTWMILLEREWSRREVAMEQAFRRCLCSHAYAESLPDSDQLRKSREKVSDWLKTLSTSSGYETSNTTSSKTDGENFLKTNASTSAVRRSKRRRSCKESKSYFTPSSD